MPQLLHRPSPLEQNDVVKLRNSCDSCQESKVKCSQDKPKCRRCARNSISCIYSPLKRIGRPRKNRAQSTSSSSPTYPKGPSGNGEARQSAYSNHGRPTNVKFEKAACTKVEPSPRTMTFGTDFGSPATFDQDSFSASARSSARIGSISDTSVYEEPIFQLFPPSVGGFNPSLVTEDYTTHLSGGFYNTPHMNGQLIGNTFPAQNTVWSDHTKLNTPIFNNTIVPRKPIQPLSSFMTGVDGEALSLEDINNMIEASMEGVLHYSSPETTTSSSETYPLPSRHNSINDSISSSSTDSPSTNTLATATSTSAALTPTALPSAPTSCASKCYAALTQQLLFLNSLVPNAALPSIDTILLLEGNARFYKEKVLACSACVANRSSLLLLSVITEQLVTILERKFEKAAITAANINRTASSKVGVAGDYYEGSEDESDRNTALTVGGVELETDVKVRYIRKLLKLRLGKFTDMVADLQDSMARMEPAGWNVGSYKAGRGIVSDALERLGRLVAAGGGAL